MKRLQPMFFMMMVLLLTIACVIPGSRAAPTATPVPPTLVPATKAPAAPTMPPVATQALVPTQPPAPTKAPVQASPTMAPPTVAPLPTATTQAALGIGSKKTVKPDNMEMVFVPAGRFLMGSVDEVPSPDEIPNHTVNISAFWMDKTEVTVAMYTQCVKAGACKEPVSPNAADFKNYYYEPTYANYPVVNIRWDDANDYCKWAGRRLPTEAEWEKAARGEDRRVYPWGNKEPDQNLANFNWLRRNPSQVGAFAQGASPYGILDMAGNVGEWVFDYYKDDYYKESPDTNPIGPATTYRGQARVQRGGNFQSSASEIRVSNRGFGMALEPKLPDSYVPTYSSTIGFRCAMPEGK